MASTDRPAAGYAPPAIATRQPVAGLLVLKSSEPGLISAHFEK